jgi:hypothetical protein
MTAPAAATWDTIFDGRTELVRKVLFGSLLVRDYDPTVDLSAFTPFDPTTGDLAGGLLTGPPAWYDAGYLDESGVSFSPQFTTTDTMGWQSRQALRTDVTEDNEEAKVVCLEAKPEVEALYYALPLDTMPALGDHPYKLTKPKTPNLIYRSILFLGIDGSGGTRQYVAKLYPRALMTKPDKQDWAPKTELQYPMTFTPYPDSVSGFSVARWHDGAGWRAYAAA